MLTTTLHFRQFVNRPQNLRIIHENAIAGIILFMVLVLIEPFDTDELDHSRYVYFIAVTMVTFIIGCSTGFFAGYVLKMPLDPKLPIRTVHRNTFILLLIYLPLTAFFVTVVYGLMYGGHGMDVWLNNGSVNCYSFMDRLYNVILFGTLIHLGTFVRNGIWHLRCQLDSLPQEQSQDIEKDIVDSHEISEEIKSIETQMMRFKGNAVHSALDIKPSRIIYVEAKANYVDFCFLDSGDPKCQQLRATLKQVKDQLDQQSSFVQCHRSYIINLHQVEKLSSEGFCHLQMSGVKKRIPVSRKYESIIKKKVAEYLTINENETVAG